LPARFQIGSVINWPDIVSNYEQYPVDYKSIIPYLVAAVVHHSDWIAETLPESHPIFVSRCWRAGAQVSLKTSILIPQRMSCENTGMIATGIPPLHAFMKQQDSHNAAILTAIENNGRTSQPHTRSAIGKFHCFPMLK
jgi:hypothetical protein